MKKIITSIIMASLISIIVLSDVSTAGEAVFCLSEEDHYVVLIESGDKCMEGETELKVSSAGIKIKDDISPLADFSVNDACPEGALGTKTDVGLDYNRNDKLEPGEILSTSSYCKSMPADAGSDRETAEALLIE
jgi:hypothetical protein